MSNDHRPWTGHTDLMDLEDPRLRLKAQALTQLCRTERESALAVYAFVKRMPFGKPMKMGLHSAREVLDRQFGDADDKATLLVALARAAGLAARVHYVALRGEVLHGLTNVLASIARPVVEMRVSGAWSATDTFIFDAGYIAGARARLESEQRPWGYGIGRAGDTLWTGSAHAFLTGPPEQAGEIMLGSLGRYDDPGEFIASEPCRRQFGGVSRVVQWNIMASLMNPAVAAVRQEGFAGGPLADPVA